MDDLPDRSRFHARIDIGLARGDARLRLLGCETKRSLYPSSLVHSASLQPKPRQYRPRAEQRATKRPPQESDGLDVTMEPATGLEPATGSLQNCYATIASCRHTKVRVEPLYDNNPDSQSSSHKRYNHQHQDTAEHVTHPNTAEGIWDLPHRFLRVSLKPSLSFIILNAN